jgi:hypothetical protein
VAARWTFDSTFEVNSLEIISAASPVVVGICECVVSQSGWELDVVDVNQISGRAA